MARQSLNDWRGATRNDIVIDDPSPANRRHFQERLLAWWDANGRKNMPWQQDRTPYRTWVSEVMLQQTQVNTVIPYFERFLARFPNLAALADAPVDEVLHLWSGLGYYARARNLHRAAGIVVRRYGGVLPRSQDALMTLPGIGRTTAAAIVAQAYGERAAILDGNVKRVLARHYGVDGQAATSVTEKALWRLAEQLTPDVRVADYTQAAMDLGAAVCVRRRPACEDCPLRGSCRALAGGDVARFPVSSLRPQRPLRRRRFFVLADANGACFVERRPPTGIWGGTWSPPERDGETSVHAFLAASEVPPSQVERIRLAPVFRHAFSHFDLDVEPIYVFLRTRPAHAGDRDGAWVRPAEHRLGLSAVAARLLATASALVGADADLEDRVTRTVFCRKYRQELPGLPAPPLPGAAGEDIFANVSARAWAEWQHLQTMLINERHLALVDPEARRFLREEMGKFLANEEYEKPAGYIPQEQG